MTAGEVSQKFKAEIIGDPGFLIDGVADPALAHPHSACLIASEQYLGSLKKSQSKCWITNQKLFKSLDENLKSDKVFILADNPFALFAHLISHFFPTPKARAGISQKADIHPEATIHPTAQIEAFVSIGAKAQVGAHVILHSGVWVGEGAVIGEGSVLYSGAKIYHRCIVGKRNVIHAGAVIGSDGFGFIKNKGVNEKIPQVGRAILHDDVEVGANSAIDRGTLDDTVIGEGTKIDNLVQVGHNSKIGKQGIFCAFVGVSGNTIVGDNVLMAGQSATKGHLQIGDNVSVGGKTGVTKDLPSNVVVKGNPPQPLNEYLRTRALYLRLPEIYKRLLRLEEKLGDNSGEQKS
ncbi:MAG: UDP-3-O-(3-hydroxymyristoyl)glucosamine N-acyltransferase [Oligoflexia bacterium]|nr:UDP-3-O-(3-hydroxymyristoyl)glucosamine N-acyltransferase [Oligoflexia bacterium]